MLNYFITLLQGDKDYNITFTGILANKCCEKWLSPEISATKRQELGTNNPITLQPSPPSYYCIPYHPHSSCCLFYFTHVAQKPAPTAHKNPPLILYSPCPYRPQIPLSSCIPPAPKSPSHLLFPLLLPPSNPLFIVYSPCPQISPLIV